MRVDPTLPRPRPLTLTLTLTLTLSLSLSLSLSLTRYQYNIQRTKWAGILEDARVVRAVTRALTLTRALALARTRTLALTPPLTLTLPLARPRQRHSSSSWACWWVVSSSASWALHMASTGWSASTRTALTNGASAPGGSPANPNP